MAKRKKKGRGRKGRPEGQQNAVAIAMRKRYANTTSTHGSRNQRRRNADSWRGDERVAWGE